MAEHSNNGNGNGANAGIEVSGFGFSTKIKGKDIQLRDLVGVLTLFVAVAAGCGGLALWYTHVQDANAAEVRSIQQEDRLRRELSQSIDRLANQQRRVAENIEENNYIQTLSDKEKRMLNLQVPYSLRMKMRGTGRDDPDSYDHDKR